MNCPCSNVLFKQGNMEGRTQLTWARQVQLIRNFSYFISNFEGSKIMTSQLLWRSSCYPDLPVWLELCVTQSLPQTLFQNDLCHKQSSFYVGLGASDLLSLEWQNLGQGAQIPQIEPCCTLDIEKQIWRWPPIHQFNGVRPVDKWRAVFEQYFAHDIHLVHSFGFELVKQRRYISTVLFTTSVCPWVCGW